VVLGFNVTIIGDRKKDNLEMNPKDILLEQKENERKKEGRKGGRKEGRMDG
jgi:hypothetical protein